jgi:hypothetical protein
MRALILLSVNLIDGTQAEVSLVCALEFYNAWHFCVLAKSLGFFVGVCHTFTCYDTYNLAWSFSFNHRH